MANANEFVITENKCEMCKCYGTGRPEWGAEPGKNYFVISWGE